MATMYYVLTVMSARSIHRPARYAQRGGVQCAPERREFLSYYWSNAGQSLPDDVAEAAVTRRAYVT